MIASLLEKVFERKIKENNRLHAIVKLSYKKYSNSGTKSKNSSLSNLDNGVVIKLKRWLVSLFHCCCLSSYFYFIIKYNYCSTVFISSCFYMVRKGGSFLLYLVISMPKKIRCSSHIRRYRIAWWCKLHICNSFLLTQFPSDPSKNFQRIPAVRSKRVKAKRWLTEYTGFTLKRMARSSRLIVKVNCFTTLVDSIIPPLPP